MTYWFFGRDLDVDAATRDSVLALDEREVLTDPRLLRVSLGVIGATVIGFLLAKPLGLEPGAIALLGAAALMLLARSDVEEVLQEVEWATLFFFVGLFMLVEASSTWDRGRGRRRPDRGDGRGSDRHDHRLSCG